MEREIGSRRGLGFLEESPVLHLPRLPVGGRYLVQRGRFMLMRLGPSSRLGSALRRVARLGQLRAKHSDAELMASLLRKQLPHHKLEQELGDPE